MNRLRHTAVAVALAVLGGACAPSANPGPATNTPATAASNSQAPVASSSAGLGVDATPFPTATGPAQGVGVGLGGDRHPYLGALPDPMPLSLAADAVGGPTWLASVARTTLQGGAQGLAAWETLLVATGTPVLDESGAPITVNGRIGTGLAVTPIELRLIGALGATPGGMTVAELGDALDGIPGVVTGGNGPKLFEALQGGDLMPGDDEGSTFLNAFYYLSLDPSRFVQWTDATDQRLSWAQIILVLRRVASEAVVYGADLASSPVGSRIATPQRIAGPGAGSAAFAASVRPPYAGGSVLAAVGPCGIEDEKIRILVDAIPKLTSAIFGKKLDKLFEEAEVAAMEAGVQLPGSLAKTQKLLKAIGLAQTIASFLAILTKAAALKATFELDAPPLVRTKSTQPGEVKDVRVSMNIDLGLYQEIVTCLNAALRPSGIQLPAIETGKANGVPMDLFSENPSVLLIGDGQGGSVAVNSRTTDADGKTSFKVSGAPQKEKIPESAAPKHVGVVLRAVAALEANDLKKDLIDLPFDALSGPIGGGIQKVLARTKWLTFYGSVDVIDWDLHAVFDATLTAFQQDHQAYAQNIISTSPCRVGLYTDSGDQSFSIRSETVRVDATLVQNPQGNWGDQAVFLLPHDQPFPPYGSPSQDLSYAPVLFRLPSTIEVDRQEHNPALPPLPPIEDYHSDCIGGGGDPGGHSVPTLGPDCGAKSYQLDMAIVVPQARRLMPFPGAPPFQELYQRCIGMDDLPGTFVDLANAGTAITVTGGQFPSIEQVFDQALDQIKITGTATYHFSQPGWLDDQDFQWTLILCRVVDEAPAC